MELLTLRYECFQPREEQDGSAVSAILDQIENCHDGWNSLSKKLDVIMARCPELEKTDVLRHLICDEAPRLLHKGTIKGGFSAKLKE